jgi:hypothetical protein
VLFRRAFGSVQAARASTARCPKVSSPCRFRSTTSSRANHGGQSSEDNLALACFYCNTHKGPNIAGVDPQSGEVVRLFHPRKDLWADHFLWDGAMMKARTPVGRATIHVLRINDPEYVAVRVSLIAEGAFPPKT